MFINMGDEIINIDNIKCFFIDYGVSHRTGKAIWHAKAETFDDKERLLDSFFSEDEAVEKIEAVAEELKKQGLLIEV